MARKTAPAVGQLRGRTRAGRLRGWDAWMVARLSDLLPAGCVDIGTGDEADTVAELSEVLTPLGCPLAVLEVHPGRAARATERLAPHGVEVQCRDALAGQGDGVAGVVRCANVLRQYPVADIPAAHCALATEVRPGGVVLEGSSDTDGHVFSFYVLRRGGNTLQREALVFGTDFVRGFAPIQFRDYLPRDVRRQVQPGGVLEAWFGRWTAAWSAVRTGHAPTDFRLAAEVLRDDNVACVAFPDGLALEWRPLGGVPVPVGVSTA